MRRHSLARIGVLAVLWGSGFLLIKVALEGMTPIQLVFGRLLAAAAVMLLVIGVKRDRLPRERSTWLHLAAMAIITNIAPYLLFAVAEQHITSSLAGVINATTPLFTLMAAVGVRMEPPSFRRYLGLIVGFFGVAILAVSSGSGGFRGSLSGILAALAGSVCYGLSFVYARRFLTGRAISPAILSTGQMVAGVALTAVLIPVFGLHPVTLTLRVVASVLALGALGTGAAYVLNYRLIEDEGPTATATVTYLLPVVAVGLGWVILAESLTWTLLAGAAIILAGVALSQSGRDESSPFPVPIGPVGGTHESVDGLDQQG